MRNVLNIEKETSKRNMPSEENKILQYKKKIIGELVEKNGEKPTTGEILEVIVEKTKDSEVKTGKKEMNDPYDVEKVLKNILLNVFNYPSAQEITKVELEEIAYYKDEIPKYKIDVDSTGAMVLKIGQNKHILPANYANVIYQSGALKKERELAQCIQENVEPLMIRYKNFYGNNELNVKDMNWLEREELALIAEEMIRTLQNLKISNHEEEIAVKIKQRGKNFFAINSKTGEEIILISEQEDIIDGIQTYVASHKFWESMLKNIEKDTKTNSVDNSYKLYCELRDLGISIAPKYYKDIEEEKLEFKFPFGKKEYDDIEYFKQASTRVSLPYTKEMIEDYEKCYKKKYGSEEFENYIRNSAKKDRGYKKREKEIKEIRKNLKTTYKIYKKLKESKFKEQEEINIPPLYHAANAATLKESEKLKQRAYRAEERDKEFQKQIKKTEFKRKVEDFMYDAVLLEELRQKKVKELAEIRRIEDVQKIIRQDELFRGFERKFERTCAIGEKSKKTQKMLETKRQKLLGTRKNKRLAEKER